jgi:hypothetical protein
LIFEVFNALSSVTLQNIFSLGLVHYHVYFTLLIWFFFNVNLHVIRLVLQYRV